ncbi:MAG: tetratricopeptide repeat protein [Microcoleaceae cyanobacterium]
MQANDILQKSIFYLQHQAETYFEQGQVEDAYKVCQQLLKLQPKHTPAYKLLGDIAQRQRNL